jgi:hypothetical protein
MKDKADSIIKGHMKPKISYYVSPLWIKIAILIFLFIEIFEAFWPA